MGLGGMMKDPEITDLNVEMRLFRRAEAVAVALFDAALLWPTEDGDSLVCKPGGSGTLWALVGWNGRAWDVRSHRGQQGQWELGEIYCPHDCRKIAHVLAGQPMPISAGEDPTTETIRIIGAIEAYGKADE